MLRNFATRTEHLEELVTSMAHPGCKAIIRGTGTQLVPAGRRMLRSVVRDVDQSVVQAIEREAFRQTIPDLDEFRRENGRVAHEAWRQPVKLAFEQPRRGAHGGRGEIRPAVSIAMRLLGHPPACISAVSSTGIKVWPAV